jgi:hypothetical protein
MRSKTVHHLPRIHEQEISKKYERCDGSQEQHFFFSGEIAERTQ